MPTRTEVPMRPVPAAVPGAVPCAAHRPRCLRQPHLMRPHRHRQLRSVRGHVFQGVVERLCDVPGTALRVTVRPDRLTVGALLPPLHHRAVNLRRRDRRARAHPHSLRSGTLAQLDTQQRVNVQHAPRLPFPHHEELDRRPRIAQPMYRVRPEHARIPVPGHLSRVVVTPRVERHTPQPNIVSHVRGPAAASLRRTLGTFRHPVDCPERRRRQRQKEERIATRLGAHDARASDRRPVTVIQRSASRAAHLAARPTPYPDPQRRPHRLRTATLAERRTCSVVRRRVPAGAIGHSDAEASPARLKIVRSRDRRPSEPLEPSCGFYARGFLQFSWSGHVFRELREIKNAIAAPARDSSIGAFQATCAGNRIDQADAPTVARIRWRVAHTLQLQSLNLPHAPTKSAYLL